MKSQFAILMVAGILGNSTLGAAEDQQPLIPSTERQPSRPLSTKKTLQWTTDYQAALKQAKGSNQAIFLFFTGSDWCTWCTKMEKDVLESKDFINTIGDKFIFVKVDLPRKMQLSPQLLEQNQALAARFHIRNYPSVVILSPNEVQIFEGSGAPDLSSKRYAEDLVELMREKMQSNASPR